MIIAPPVPGYVDFSGNITTVNNGLSVDSSPGLSLGSDRCFVFLVRCDDWSVDTQVIVRKYPEDYLIYQRTNGALNYFYVYWGLNLVMSSPLLVRPANGSWQWFAITQRLNDGAGGKTTRLFRSPEGATWTETGAPGATLAGTAVPTAGSSAMTIASFSPSPTLRYRGGVGHFSVRNGCGPGGTVGGTEVFRFDGATDLLGVNPAATTITASSGQTINVLRFGSPSTVLVPTAPRAYYGTKPLLAAYMGATPVTEVHYGEA